MHGPGFLTETNPFGWQPHWPDLPTIRVVDGVALTLRPIRRAIWRKARDKALTRWEPSGLKLSITEAKNDTIPMGKIALIRTEVGYMGYENGRPAYASWNEAAQGSGAYFKPDGLRFGWRAYLFYPLVGVICHEVGHCLGLAHGGGGVMAGGWKPSDHDLESVRSWYADERNHH